MPQILLQENHSTTGSVSQDKTWSFTSNDLVCCIPLPQDKTGHLPYFFFSPVDLNGRHFPLFSFSCLLLSHLLPNIILIRPTCYTLKKTRRRQDKRKCLEVKQSFTCQTNNTHCNVLIHFLICHGTMSIITLSNSLPVILFLFISRDTKNNEETPPVGVSLTSVLILRSIHCTS